MIRGGAKHVARDTGERTDGLTTPEREELTRLRNGGGAGAMA